MELFAVGAALIVAGIGIGAGGLNLAWQMVEDKAAVKQNMRLHGAGSLADHLPG